MSCTFCCGTLWPCGATKKTDGASACDACCATCDGKIESCTPCTQPAVSAYRVCKRRATQRGENEAGGGGDGVCAGAKSTTADDGVYENDDHVYENDDGVYEHDDGVYGRDDGVYGRDDDVCGRDVCMDNKIEWEKKGKKNKKS